MKFYGRYKELLSITHIRNTAEVRKLLTKLINDDIRFCRLYCNLFFFFAIMSLLRIILYRELYNFLFFGTTFAVSSALWVFFMLRLRMFTLVIRFGDYDILCKKSRKWNKYCYSAELFGSIKYIGYSKIDLQYVTRHNGLFEKRLAVIVLNNGNVLKDESIVVDNNCAEPHEVVYQGTGNLLVI